MALKNYQLLARISYFGVSGNWCAKLTLFPAMERLRMYWRIFAHKRLFSEQHAVWPTETLPTSRLHSKCSRKTSNNWTNHWRSLQSTSRNLVKQLHN
jgi:hypothetical protein